MTTWTDSQPTSIHNPLKVSAKPVSASQISTGAVHHATLAVDDVGLSPEFYTGVLGFEVAAEFGTRIILLDLTD